MQKFPSTSCLSDWPGCRTLDNLVAQGLECSRQPNTLQAISKPSVDDHEASDVKECFVDGVGALVANDEAAKIAEPGNGSFDLPPTLVPAQRSAILGARLAAIPAMRGDQFDASGR